MTTALTWRIEELSEKGALQLAYIARFYPDAEVSRACEERLARRGFLDRKRSALDRRVAFASLWLAITHGADEDFEEGCFSIAEKEIARASSISAAVLTIAAGALIYGIATLQNPLLRAALAAGAVLMMFAKGRKRR